MSSTSPRLQHYKDTSIDACLNCTVHPDDCDGEGGHPGCQFYAQWKQKLAEGRARQAARKERAK
jgi:hypothetical protein